MRLIKGKKTRGLSRRPVRVSRHTLYEVGREGVAVHEPAVPVLYRRGELADLLSLGLEHDYDDVAREYGQARIDKGDILMLGESADGIVFTCWLCFGQVELDYRVFLAAWPSLAFVYKVFVAPGQRGKRIYPGAYGAIRDILVERKVGRLMTIANAKNTAANAVAVRCGYHGVGHFHRVDICGLPLYAVGSHLLRRIRGEGISGKTIVRQDDGDGDGREGCQ